MKHLCSACGSPTRANRGSYHYTESGLDNIILKNVELLHCDACGNEDPVIEGMDAVHEKIAQALAERPGHLDGREFRFLRKHLELTARKLSDVLSVDHATISKWENGKDPIGPQSERLMRAIVMTKPKQRASVLRKLARHDDDAETNSNIEINEGMALHCA